MLIISGFPLVACRNICLSLPLSIFIMKFIFLILFGVRGVVEEAYDRVLDIDKVEALYDHYDEICKGFLDLFIKPECIEFDSLSLTRICSGEFEIIFLTQFTVEDKNKCQADMDLLNDVKKEAVLFRSLMQIQTRTGSNFDFDELFEYIAPISTHFPELVQSSFNYMKGDQFYEPPSAKLIVERLLSLLSLLCSDLSSLT